MNNRNSILLFVLLLCICAGCATVGGLEGGKKDTTPPKLVAITPGDSLLNTKVSKIELRFDEYIALNDPAKEIQISPLLAVPPTVTGLNKKVTVKIPDSLLMENTTYRISFGSSVKDIHEDNKISGLTYTFSTGSYFDSLEVNGKVINARTGLADSAAVILLYNGTVDDSAVVRSRPLYIGRTKPDGTFSVKGLPGRSFKVYALKDGNDNLVYDGGKEKIAFNDGMIFPGDSMSKLISLRIFEEIQDTSSFSDTAATSNVNARGKPVIGDQKDRTRTEDLTYNVAVDSSDHLKRTKDITKPLEIVFNKEITSIAENKISLSLDSNDTQPITLRIDSVRKNVLLVTTDWKEDAVYTLRLQKGFAKDSADVDALPSKYQFRSKRDDDYSKLIMHLPSKYSGNKYLLLIKSDKDTTYYKPVTDTTITITRLNPGSYSARIIVDENENGIWDTGDLLLKKQPEYVIPYLSGTITLKPGWDNIVDFETKAVNDRKGASPGKRDKETRK
jgi:hypothetical protein